MDNEFLRRKLAFVITILFLASSITSSVAININNNFSTSISNDSNFYIGESGPENYTSFQDVASVLNNNLLYGDRAYAYEAYPDADNFYYFSLDDPGNLTFFGELGGGDFLSAGTWTNDYRWLCCYYGSGRLLEIDIETGEVWIIGGGGAGLNALAFDPASKKMYGSSDDDYLVEINTDNGEQELIGPFGGDVIYMIGMAFDNNGTLFGWDLGDKLWSIDTDTGAASLVGPLGIDLIYAQDGDYYRKDDILYLAAYIKEPFFGSFLYTCDTDNGNCTLIGQIEDDLELSVLTIPYAWDIPYVDFTWSPELPAPGETVFFNASNSYDPDGHITLYEWDWDSDGVFDEKYVNPFAEHSWDETGNYPITLRVTDNTGLNMSKTIKVLVNRPPDKPKICGPRIVELGMKYTYTIKGTDPDNDDLREFIVDWGDGYGYGLQGTFPSGTVKDFEHFWSENGTFTVKARVRDIYWVSSDWATIKVFVPRNKIVNNLWFDCFSDRFPILERFISWIVHL